MKKGAFKNFLSELRRRNVYKSALAYVVGGWILLQVLAVTLPSFEMPLSIIKWTVVCLIIGFPFWLIFSWIYELTPDGIKKTVDVPPSESISSQTGDTLKKVIIGALAIAIVLLLVDIFKPFGIGNPEKNVQLTNATVTSEEDAGMERSIAVLAFADMSPNKDQEYFSDGISEEILNLLAQIRELKVISRTSSFSFKGENATTAEIGEALNVNYILEGSVRKSGNTLRITAQLIKVSDGTHVWSETFDREMVDIFEIQDEIATRVTKELKAKLMVGDIRSQEVDTDAYELYLKARYEEVSESGVARAEDLLKQSIAIDPNYAPAWIALAEAQLRSGGTFGLRSLSEALTMARGSAQEAIRIDPNNAEAYVQLADIQWKNWEFEKAALTAKRAWQLEPEDIKMKTRILSIKFARPDEAIVLFKKAIDLNPLDYVQYFNLGLYLMWERRYEESMEALNIYERHYSQDAVLHHIKSKVLLAQGKKEEALEEAKKEPDDFFRLYSENLVAYAMGRKKEADSLLNRFIQEYKNDGGAVNIADIYAYRGDVDNTFLWLEKALEEKDATLLEGVFYPNFEVLYGDPRWEQLINKMGLPEGHGVPMGK